MDRSQFLSLADKCLNQVADWLEDFDPDEVDFDTTDGVVNIEFPDRTKYVLNRQSASHQMWFAAGVSAYHYDWDGTRWQCDKDSHPLLEEVQSVVAKKLGRELSGLA